MKVEVHYKHSNTAARIELESGESCTTEAGSMVAMNSHISVETTTYKKGKGSILKSLKRMITGESFFLNHYTARQPGEIWVSTTLPGDIEVHELQGQRLIVQAGSFLAAEDDVEIDTGWQGFKGLLSGEWFFWLKLTGQGKVLLSSFGTIYAVDVEDEYVVDTGHIVAFDESLKFEISKAGTSWIKSFLGGEGFVCRFKGKGRVYCQSHHPREFGLSLRPHLKVKRR